MEGTLFTGVVAVMDGEWFDARGLGPIGIEVSGITTATAQIRGSNATAKPADNTHGSAIGADITADGIVRVDTPVCWMKVRVSAWTSGTIAARLVGYVN